MTSKKKRVFVQRAYIEELAVARIAMRLADLLEKCNKTQKSLARELRVTEAWISQLFSGNANPTVKTLARLAEALGHEFDPQFVLASPRPRIHRNRRNRSNRRNRNNKGSQ